MANPYSDPSQIDFAAERAKAQAWLDQVNGSALTRKIFGRIIDQQNEVIRAIDSGDQNWAMAAINRLYDHQDNVQSRTETRDVLGAAGLAAITAGGLGFFDPATVAAEGSAAAGGTAAAEGAAAAGGAAAGEGVALGSGITAGTTATGIGGGATGTGLTAGTTAAGIGGEALGTGIATSAATGALAPGYFAAETLYPVAGGITAAGTATAANAAGSAAGGGLSRVLNGTATADDWIDILGRLAPAALGAYASDQQADAIRDIANQSRADRAPFLSAATGYLANPTSYVEGPGRASMEGVLRRLSVNGNPAHSPTAQGVATEAGLRDWRDAVTGFANLGLAGEDTRANLGLNAARADANVWNAVGGGVADVLNPPKSLADLIKEFETATGGRRSSGSTYSLV